MMVRSVVLFGHVAGMLALSVGLGLEWLSLESLRRATSPAQASPWLRVCAALPRVRGLAFALILVPGAYLAVRVGVSDAGWVRVSFGAMVLMGILGGPVVRSRMRAIGLAGADDRDTTSETLRRLASHPLLRASLRLRAVVGLAIVYLMISKLDLGESVLLIGVTLALGAALSVPPGRPQSTAVGASR